MAKSITAALREAAEQVGQVYCCAGGRGGKSYGFKTWDAGRGMWWEPNGSTYAVAVFQRRMALLARALIILGWDADEAEGIVYQRPEGSAREAVKSILAGGV